MSPPMVNFILSITTILGHIGGFTCCITLIHFLQRIGPTYNTQGIGMTWAEPPAAGADFPGHLRRRGCGTAAGSPSRTPGGDDGHGSAA
jgi:hypothetical protein